ncbi:carbon-nitrogen hydrolase family protein [Candidatus Bathyarchaeota archaeon A05DMB-2]|jgi:predicted amidohydrolase|nr:carbon-nitrogen hydrolase family protein [Candidatus Bathyarchaeota archaeon A05DMB-2]
MKVRTSLKANLEAASATVRKAAEKKPAFIALPEYFSVPNNMEHFDSAEKISKETYEETMKFLADISKEFPSIYILGGTVLEEDHGVFYNTSTLWRNGSLIKKYRKRNPIAVELKAGVSRGDKPAVLTTDHCTVGLLVCADMFDQPTIKAVVDLGAELVFLPVAAMGTHPHVAGHPLTEKLASENGIYVVKVGNVSSNARGGRSAFITPWGIEQEVSDAVEDSVMTIDFDMHRLREYRKSLKKKKEKSAA